jgi:hypothetical protein
MPVFRELTGTYSDGQRVTPVEYSDHFEAIGTSFARHPDGAGGPFVYNFRRGDGHVVGSIGWALSVASRRHGAWQLWGMVSEGQAFPALALPLLWKQLRSRDDLSRLKERVEGIGEAFGNPDDLLRLLEQLPRDPMKDDLRQGLRALLHAAYAKYAPGAGSIPIDVTPETLDALPWLSLLGPVPPRSAQLQPRPFHEGIGYAYVLKQKETRLESPRVNSIVHEKIDAALKLLPADIAGAWAIAEETRGIMQRSSVAEVAPPGTVIMSVQAPRERIPKRPEAPQPRPVSAPVSSDAMLLSEQQSALLRDLSQKIEFAYQWVIPVTLFVLLAFAALNFWFTWTVRQELDQLSRQISDSNASVPDPSLQQPAVATDFVPPTQTSTAPPLPLHTRLAARPPAGIILDEAFRTRLTESEPTRLQFAAAAVEIFMRLEGCQPLSKPVNGQISDERAAIADCPKLQTAGLMTEERDMLAAKATQWLERQVPR